MPVRLWRIFRRRYFRRPLRLAHFLHSMQTLLWEQSQRRLLHYEKRSHNIPPPLHLHSHSQLLSLHQAPGLAQVDKQAQRQAGPTPLGQGLHGCSQALLVRRLTHLTHYLALGEA